MRKLILTIALLLPLTSMAQSLFPDSPVDMKPGYGADGAGLHYGRPVGIPGNDCVINPVSMTHMRSTQTKTVTTMVAGDIISIPATVLFDFDKDIVLPEGESVLADRIYAKLVEFGVEGVDVVGHTDSKGSDEYNDGLGLRRADAVAAVLVYLGFPSEAVTASSGGEKFPLVANENADGSDNPEGRQTNRRVELVVSRVADIAVDSEVEEEVIVARNPQIFHRLSSSNTVLCEGPRFSGRYALGYYWF